MGSKSYPPLTPTEVISILEALQFKLKKQTGSHAHYELDAALDSQGIRRVVTVDMSVAEFWVDLMQSMIRQSGVDRKKFYGATKKTKRKI